MAAAVDWEVAPTQVVVKALMETLVDPRLPRAYSNDPPSEDAQKSVAKQVIIYIRVLYLPSIDLNFLNLLTKSLLKG